MGPLDGAGHLMEDQEIRQLELPIPPTTSKKVVVVGGWRSSFIKALELEDLGSFWVVEHTKVSGRSLEALWLLLPLCPKHLFHLVISQLYPL